MRHLGVCLVFAVVAVLGWAAPAFAQAGGPELKTDDPYFPGEGAMSTPARVIQRANAINRGSLGSATQRDKFIRLFLWRSENFSHLTSPAVYNLPGVTPDPKADNGLMIDYDAMRALFSYGWGLCGTNHGQMRVFADEAGWASRRRGLQGDTGYEILVDGGWRYCNTDQYTIHFLSNSGAAHFASVDEVIGTNHHYAEWNPDLGMGYRLPQANTHGSYQDFAGVTGTVPNRSLQWRSYYQSVWAPPNNYKLYGEGYTYTPVVVRLRRGETFTRWLAPDGAVTELGLAGRIWWGYNGGNLGGGDNTPYSQWSFVQNAPARDETPGGAEESRGQQRYGNGCFLWQPSLAAGEHLDGAFAVTGVLNTGGAPALRSSGNSTLVLFQNTPYTIAARPANATDPATASSDGAKISANTVGTVGVEVSVNAGATWTSIGTLSGNGASVDFTDAVKGRNQYLLRLSFGDGEGLDTLSLRTVTMLNQAVYPNLKSGSTQVTYAASNTGALDLSPDLWTAASANSATGYVQKVADSGNVSGVYYSGEAFGYSATNNNPMSVTYKVTIPPALAAAGATWKQLTGAANCSVRVPPSGAPYTRVEISPNQTTWTKIGEYLPPSDNEFSSYWAYGRSADGATLGGTDYYIRVTTWNGGAAPSKIRYLRFGGTYTVPASSAPVEVTYHWNNGTAQTNTHAVAPGSSSDTWSITTGTVASQTKVVLRVPSGTVTPAAPTITTQPMGKTVTEGQTATFSVAVNGTAPFTYQWRKNGTNIPGATGASYTTPATTLADSGSTFSVVVTNGQGSATSNNATLTVNPAGPGGGSTTVTLQQGVNGYMGVTDTFLDQFAPTTPYGGLDRFKLWYFTNTSGVTENRIPLLRFDLSSIPANATVTSSTLTLYSVRATSNSTSDVVSIDKVLGAWTDAHTYSMGVPASSPSGVPTPGVDTFVVSPALPEAWVVTGMGPLVQGWVTTPASNLGLKLSVPTSLNVDFASVEWGWPYSPTLAITYTTSGGGGDTTPPTMAITSPTSGPASSSPLTVSGTASDAGGVTQVTWSNALTGGSGTATGTTSWSASIPLAPGTNDITISVTDSSGNTTTSLLSMTFAGGASPAAGGGGSGGGDGSCGMGSASPQASFPWVAMVLGLLLAVRRRS